MLDIAAHTGKLRTFWCCIINDLTLIGLAVTHCVGTDCGGRHREAEACEASWQTG